MQCFIFELMDLAIAFCVLNGNTTDIELSFLFASAECLGKNYNETMTVFGVIQDITIVFVTMDILKSHYPSPIHSVS